MFSSVYLMTSKFSSMYFMDDYVEVIIKHSDYKKNVWESKIDGNFKFVEGETQLEMESHWR